MARVSTAVAIANGAGGRGVAICRGTGGGEGEGAGNGELGTDGAMATLAGAASGLDDGVVARSWYRGRWKTPGRGETYFFNRVDIRVHLTVCTV